jgi:hypothetical protein
MSTQHCKTAISAPDAEVCIGVEGIYDFRVYKANADGTAGALVRELLDVHNLITDFGMDSMGNVSQSSADVFWAECVVGTGNAPPQFSDTALQTFRAGTQTVLVAGSVTRQIVTSPRWIEVARTWRFPAGAASGNLTEVGVRRQTGAPQHLFSRALIVDGGGQPTALTVLSDEILDVTFRFRWFVPENDVTGTVTLNGVPHNWTLRAVAIHQTASVGSTPGWPASQQYDFGIRARRVDNINTASRANSVATVAMTAPDQLPVLDGIISRGASGHQSGAYTPGSHFLDSIYTWGLSEGNSADIRLAVMSVAFGSFQIGFSPPFTKLNTQQLRFTLRVSWARRP